MTDQPPIGVLGHVTRILNLAASLIFLIGEAMHFKFRVLFDTEAYLCMCNRLPPKGTC